MSNAVASRAITPFTASCTATRITMPRRCCRCFRPSVHRSKPRQPRPARIWNARAICWCATLSCCTMATTMKRSTCMPVTMKYWHNGTRMCRPITTASCWHRPAKRSYTAWKCAGWYGPRRYRHHNSSSRSSLATRMGRYSSAGHAAARPKRKCRRSGSSHLAWSSTMARCACMGCRCMCRRVGGLGNGRWGLEDSRLCPPNGLAFSCRKRAGRSFQKANDRAREAVSCNAVLGALGSSLLVVAWGVIGHPFRTPRVRLVFPVTDELPVRIVECARV
jgi:hypothetical protein